MIILPDCWSMKMVNGWMKVMVSSIRRNTAATEARTPVNATSNTSSSKTVIAWNIGRHLTEAIAGEKKILERTKAPSLLPAPSMFNAFQDNTDLYTP